MKSPAHGILTGKSADYAIVALILCAAALLLFLNLGDQYLWQDEAQTALVAKTVLTHGMPVGYDGKNYFSQEMGAEYGKNYVWKWHTWFPFYVLAGFFAVLGPTTFAARLPFALFGIATILLLYYFSRSLWKSRRAGITASVLLMLSVPFLILARQCRYYSPAAFFSLLALFGYTRLIERKRHGALVFILASVLLFNTHYPYYAAILATVFVHSLLFHRDRFKTVLLASLGTLALNLPWIIWFSTMTYGIEHSQDFLNLEIAGNIAGQFIHQIGMYVFPPLLLALPAAAGVLHWVRTRRFPTTDRETVGKLSLPILFSVLTVAAFSFTAPDGFFRYLAPLLPVSCLVMALVLESGMRVHVGIGLAILAVFAYTGSMRDYAYELTHDFEGPMEGIVGYLNEHAAEDDIVAITYEDLPLKFYTNLRVVGALTGEDQSPAKQATWVIIRKYPIVDPDREFGNYLMRNLRPQDFERIMIDYPDTPFQNRESPDLHKFRTDTVEDRVVIFHRRGR